MKSAAVSVWLTSWFTRTCIPNCTSGEADTAEEPTPAWQLEVGTGFPVCCVADCWVTLSGRRARSAGNSSSIGPACQKAGAPLTLANLGQVSPAKLGPEILWKRTDFWKRRHAYFRRGGNAKMDWRVLKACSHIFHWYQSHMAGFYY